MRRRGRALHRRYGRAGYVPVGERYKGVSYRLPKEDAPAKSFTSPGGRTFHVGKGTTTKPRFKGDIFWSNDFPITLGGKEVGSLSRNVNYGLGPDGKPKWQATLTKLVWSGEHPPTGLGFDVSGCDTAEECLRQYGWRADEVLDWREGKEVKSMYAKGGVYRRETP